MDTGQKINPGMNADFSWTKRVLADKVRQFGWEIGDYTYGIPRIVDEKFAKLSIGTFCSIAENVAIVLGNHRVDTFTTYPFTALFGLWPGGDRSPDHTTKGDVVIGSNVWLAQGSTICSGVNVGHGAIIAINSVVTKDVPPYAVVGGNPGKVIRQRFSDEVIADLLDIAWWDWPYEKVNANLPLIMSDDIEALKAAAKIGLAPQEVARVPNSMDDRTESLKASITKLFSKR